MSVHQWVEGKTCRALTWTASVWSPDLVQCYEVLLFCWHQHLLGFLETVLELKQNIRNVIYRKWTHTLYQVPGTCPISCTAILYWLCKLLYTADSTTTSLQGGFFLSSIAASFSMVTLASCLVSAVISVSLASASAFRSENSSDSFSVYGRAVNSVVYNVDVCSRPYVILWS